MIVLLGLVLIGVMAVTLAYTFDRIRRQEQSLEGYRILVLEWYMYLHNKEHSEDFELWRRELGG